MSGTAEMQGEMHAQAWLTLSLVPRLGPVTCRRLVASFGSPEAVLEAGIVDLRGACTLHRESLEALGGAGRAHLEATAQEEFAHAAAREITLIPCDDPRYPTLLQQIHDPPVLLYLRGNVAALNSRCIALVGSRSASHYGISVASMLAKDLAGLGFTVVSGMALGIDGAAHRAVLDAGGRTIGVLGCGLDIVYPPGNNRLFQEIIATGAIVSEYPLGSRPESFRFPARNRIISGLSFGVVVIEAANRSGSLITAGHALEQGREVFAVPGRIDSMKSSGTHTLLKQGAKLVHSVQDIIEEFQPGTLGCEAREGELHADTEKVADLDPDEAALFALLDVYPLTIDEIARISGFAPQRTSELLLLLELKGLVESLPGKNYKRSKDFTR